MLYMEFYLRDRVALLGDRPALMDIIEKYLRVYETFFVN